jgi:hypothetical protein
VIEVREDRRVDPCSNAGGRGRNWIAARFRAAAGPRAIAGLVAVLMLTAAAPAEADRYDSKRSGFPLRIVAYVVHPIGVIIDTLIFRPAHWVGSKEPLKTLFGHTGD